MPRNTITPDAVEAVRKALEQLASKPKSVTERGLIEIHKDLLERALANGYDFKDIAGVAAAVGVNMPVARIRKYYQEAQGIPSPTRRKRGEDSAPLSANGNGVSSEAILTEAPLPFAATGRKGNSVVADKVTHKKDEAQAPEKIEAAPTELPAKTTRRKATSSETGTARATGKTTRSSSNVPRATKSEHSAGNTTGRRAGRKKTS